MSNDAILAAAQQSYGAGLCVLPVAEDGTKRPDCSSWEQYKRSRPSRDQMRDWFSLHTRSGLGVVCGQISGGLECFEFDDRVVYDQFKDTAQLTGLGDLVEGIEQGFCEDTPGGGVHWLYRCDGVEGSTKLARRPKTADERQGEGDRVKVLIETRGEGGCVIVTPSGGPVHPSGRSYTQRSGGFESIATIQPDERTKLFNLAKSFDEMPRREVNSPTGRSVQDGRPGDDYNQRTTWAEVLEPHGWTPMGMRGEATYWRRPGKTDRGMSATTNHASSDFLYIFSTSTEFESERGYSKFAAYAVLNHEEDFGAAAKALAARGFGDQPAALPDAPHSDPSTLDCEALLVEHELHSLDTGINRAVLEGRLRKLVVALRGSDRLHVALVREALIAQLKAAKIGSPAVIVDAALKVQRTTSENHQGTTLLLADVEPWPEPVDGNSVLDDVVRTITRFIVLPTHGAVALALWILHTYVMGAWWLSPLAVVTSPTRRCGKTALLMVVSELVHCALAASNISPAALFRAVEKFQPTLLLDEGETWLKANEELRGIVNAGHTRPTAMVIRTVGDDHEPATFSTWCPKFIALIGTLSDTIMDRAIVIEMRRKTAEERVERLRLDHLPDICGPLCRQMARWALDHADGLATCDPEVPTGLHDRAVDNWRPLLALSDSLGEEWSTRARAAARALAGVEQEDTLAVQLLWDIKEVFDDEVMSSADIVTALIALDGRPWATYSRQDKPLTTNSMARLLSRFHIRPSGNLRVGDKVRKGYCRAAFVDSWARYPLTTATRNKPNKDGPQLDKPNRYTDPPVVVAENGISSMNTGGCYGVAVETEGPAADEELL